MQQVLVIDDDHGTLDSFERVLCFAGFGVTTAATGRYGLGLARRARFDVILSDLRLPDISGLDVLQQLNTDSGRGRFILMTAWGSHDHETTALRLGALGYAQKPLVGDALVELVIGAARRSGGSHPTLPWDYRVADVMRVIAARLHEHRLTVRVVANELRITTEHLCRLMKRQTGLPFGIHLHRARVAEARHLLRTTNLSVKEIADRVGYSTTTRLDRQFLSSTAMTPTEYRRFRLSQDLNSND